MARAGYASLLGWSTSDGPFRYEDIGLIGAGGMGEVRRVRDRVLGRTVAMKRVRADLARDPEVRARFRQEARVVAGLQHPGIVPLFDFGDSEDGVLWFTMPEVRGRTLASVLTDRRDPSLMDGQDRDGPALRRLVGLFGQVCRAVVHAHEHGVVHRDLKPANVMIGALGEVQVMDFGVAKRTGERDFTTATLGSTQTRLGEAMGTPAYMAPEQARGEAVGPAADVFSLGAMLCEILVGEPPYGSDEGGNTLIQAFLARPVAWRDRAARTGLVPPDDLEALCTRALASEPSDRPAAAALATAVEDWLDGVRRLDEARGLVTSAVELRASAQRERAEAHAASERAAAILAALPTDAAPDEKVEVWSAQDEAESRLLSADRLEVQYEQGLTAALNRWPGLPEARWALATHWRDQLIEAWNRRDPRAAGRYEALLRADGTLVDWLDADVPFRLVTEPAGLPVAVQRYELRGRRLVPSTAKALGRTPLDSHLPAGGWRLQLGAGSIGIPVVLDRSGVDPWCDPSGKAHVHRVPADLGPEDCWVPAGWAVIGGDELAPDSLQRLRVWVDAFVMRKFPVTNAEYLEFLHDVGPSAERFVPRATGNGGAPTYRAVGVGWGLPAELDPHSPAVLVDLHSARTYAAWRAERDQLSWRLPTEIEWEKAARGPDGRRWPWGDHFEPAWARTVVSLRPPSLGPVTEFPMDEGPYGVRGLAGGVRDWTATAYTATAVIRDGERAPNQDQVGLHQVVKGGAWSSSGGLCRPAARFGGDPDNRYDNLGFRLVRGVDPSIKPASR